mmetsp:Transcript_92412/g.270521  ORF Transcript_92412/g.270521 Transcript_92412/m.270521 type:complete len:214 (+) Transcript_92412:72-713(+)
MTLYRCKPNARSSRVATAHTLHLLLIDQGSTPGRQLCEGHRLWMSPGKKGLGRCPLVHPVQVRLGCCSFSHHHRTRVDTIQVCPHGHGLCYGNYLLRQGWCSCFVTCRHSSLLCWCQWLTEGLERQLTAVAALALDNGGNDQGNQRHPRAGQGRQRDGKGRPRHVLDFWGCSGMRSGHVPGRLRPWSQERHGDRRLPLLHIHGGEGEALQHGT